MAKWDAIDDVYSETPLAERQAFQARMGELAAEERGRRAKVSDLQRQVQVLQGRIQARDALIRRQQAKIAQLQQQLLEQARTIIITRAANG